MDMKIHATQQARVITLSGRFDAFEAPQLIQWFEANVTEANAKVVVNLDGVNFLDSAALASLVKGMKRCREAGGDLILCQLQQPVRIIFELTRLDKAFKIVADTETAQGSFA